MDTELMSYQCSICLVWSTYCRDLPKGWRDTDKGYFCNNCRKEK